MSFEVANELGSFQNFNNDVLVSFLDMFVTAYLDDILIYSNTLEKDQDHVDSILIVLFKEELHLKPEKCKFHREEVKYLGLIIRRDCVKMNPVNVTVVSDWPVPKCSFHVRPIVGFANLY